MPKPPLPPGIAKAYRLTIRFRDSEIKVMQKRSNELNLYLGTYVRGLIAADIKKSYGNRKTISSLPDLI